MLWQKDNLLRVGQTVTETTRVLSAAGKRTKAGEEMVVVGVEKEFANEAGVAVVDQRSVHLHLFVRLIGSVSF